MYNSTASLYVEDVENLLHESLLLSFNTDIEDGSIEEVQIYDIYIYMYDIVCKL